MNPNDAPGSFRQMRGSTVVVEVIPRHSLIATSGGCQIITFRDTNVNRIGNSGILVVTLRAVTVTGNNKGMGFILHAMEKTKHDAVTYVSAKQRSRRISMYGTTEQPGDIFVRLEPRGQ